MARIYSRRGLIWFLAIAFVVIGVYFAGTRRFERWAGQELQEAAPAARRVIPFPAKTILRKSREHLPVYGETSVWLARKSGSVLYFGMIGLFALMLRKRRPTSLGETLLVTVAAGVGMSTIVEIFEFPEELPDVALDLACGAAGGLAVGLLAWALLRRTLAPRV